MPLQAAGLEVYELKELSDILKIHLATLRHYCKSGRLKAQKIGRRWLVSSENVKAFLNGPGSDNAYLADDSKAREFFQVH